jgi:hypothetical protein
VSQEDCDLKVSLGCIIKSCLQNEGEGKERRSEEGERAGNLLT